MGKITYTIDERKKIINTICAGDISLEEFKVHVNSLLHDPKFQSDMDSITDIRDADLDNSFLTFSSLRDHLRMGEAIRGKFKWAIIINSQKDPSAIKLFQTLLQDGIFLLKLFTNKNEAERWICKKSDS